MSETNAMGLGQDLGRFRPCVGRSKIKRAIKLRLFKTADAFVGANRRTGLYEYTALIPPIDGRIQGFWDPIPVSPDTVETTTEFSGDYEEVDRPADAFGASLSGNFYFEP
ncbi:hypothetical protein DY000_02008446 [Brassica cretica]|uniref:Uncharacterized protein n=1 Tax=Brassica cretica TaxID=69181 RepID=A0ABQ7CHC5_BRACR|nr:hypothetical protein DY000_02008446 [Brassica cretica]